MSPCCRQPRWSNYVRRLEAACFYIAGSYARWSVSPWKLRSHCSQILMMMITPCIRACCDESSLPTPPMQVPPPGPASSCCGLAASVGKQHAGPRSDAELALPAVAATRSTQDHGNFLCRLWAAVAASIRSDVRREGASDRPLPARSADARLALLEHYSLDRVSPVTALQRSWSSGLRPIRSLESSERFGPQP